jgi:hypothetical protein
MTQWLEQLTAGTVMIGPFVDDTDGKTAETALTISQGDILLSKNGGAFAQISGTANATHGTLGYYAVDYGTADASTLGRLKLAVHKSGALPVWHDYMIVPANTWNSLIGGTDYLDVTAVGTVTANVVGGTVAAVSGAVIVSAGTVTTVTDPVTVTGGTVTVSGAVTVSGGTVDVATTVTDPVTVSAGTVTAVSGTVTASLAARTVEGSIDEIEAWRVALAALAGKTSGGGTGTLVFRDTGDSKDRITATVDANKNRTAISLDAS